MKARFTLEEVQHPRACLGLGEAGKKATGIGTFRLNLNVTGEVIGPLVRESGLPFCV